MFSQRYSQLLTSERVSSPVSNPEFFATFQWRSYSHISIFTRHKTLANSLHNPQEGVQEIRILR
ncbi:hypothetical protein Gotur_020730 [Gossypium turneri]